MKSRIYNQTGQSLIEAIIGISILVAGVVTALALGIMTIRSGQISQSRTIADNLAREALEQVRAIRDSNWLADQNAVEDGNPTWRWDLNLCDDEMTTAKLVIDPDTFFSSISWTEESIDQAVVYRVSDPDRSLVYYQQISDANGGTPPADSTPTVYRRWIQIEPQPATNNCVSVAPDLVPDYYVVTATVQWVESGATHTAELREDLYNWRP